VKEGGGEKGSARESVRLFSLVPLVWEPNPELQGGWYKTEPPAHRGYGAHPAPNSFGALPKGWGRARLLLSTPLGALPRG